MQRTSIFRSLLTGAIVAAATMASAVAEDAKVKDAEELSVGDKAPDFTAVNVAGEKVSLSDYEGKPVVLLFTRAHW